MRLTLLDVTRFVVVSRPVLDRFAPPGRRSHGIAVETRDGQRHDLGWEFLDEAGAAAAAAAELDEALAACTRGARGPS